PPGLSGWAGARRLPDAPRRAPRPKSHPACPGGPTRAATGELDFYSFRLTTRPAHPMFSQNDTRQLTTGFLDKGKPPARLGRKAMGPLRIARLPKGASPPGNSLDALDRRRAVVRRRV